MSFLPDNLKLSVGQKVVSIVGVFFAFLIVIAFTAVKQIGYVGNEVERMGQLYMPLFTSVREIDAHNQDQWLNFLKIIQVGGRVVYDGEAEEVFLSHKKDFEADIQTIRLELEAARKLLNEAIGKAAPDLKRKLQEILADLERVSASNQIFQQRSKEIFQGIMDGRFLMAMEGEMAVLESRRSLEQELTAVRELLDVSISYSVSAAEQVETTATRLTLVVTLLLTIAGLVLTFWFVRNSLSQPLRYLTEAMDRFNLDATSVSLADDVPALQSLHQRRDEIGVLVGSFTSMREKLIEANGALRKAHNELEQRVADRTRELSEANLDLHAAKDAAENANRAKSIFLANMSHELRTPLNAILGFSELMVRDHGTTLAQRKNLDSINRSGAHLLAMINDVLDISKIEAGKIELHPKPFELPLFLDEIGNMIHSSAQARDLTFTMTHDPDLARYVTADAGKIRQVLINLLGNAVKFTREGGVILRARTRSSGDSLDLVIEVEDSGPGIPADRLETIFEPFIQVAGEASAQKGTGLGLAISHSYLKLMGGEIRVESTLGKGALFQVNFPLAIAAAEEVEQTDESSHCQVESLAEDEPERRILVVDDNYENRRLLTTLLTQAGFQMREAENGITAVDQFETWQPHLIWMDMRMPVMDGYEATRLIREKSGGSEVKILALTASVFEDQTPEILAAGCDEVLFKPFKAYEIFNAMERQLGVVYAYTDAVAIPEETAPGQKIDAECLAGLPKEWLDELQHATIVLDLDRLKAIIDRIAERDPKLSKSLASMMEHYEFDRLQALFGQYADNDSKKEKI